MVTLQILPWRNANGPIGLYNITMEGVDTLEVNKGQVHLQVGECKKSFVAEWLFCEHVNKYHFFIMPTSRFSHLSIGTKEPKCLDHTIMNVCILGNPYKCHKWNEAKNMDHAKKKTTT
jgi:hypothetical protein